MRKNGACGFDQRALCNPSTGVEEVGVCCLRPASPETRELQADRNCLGGKERWTIHEE